MTPLLSVISVNYNGLELTCRMVDSLLRWNTVPAEIIVVDNGSRADEAAELRRRYPLLTVIRSERNLGFAGGNNLGIRAACGRYLLFLNNDTEIEEDGLGYLCRTLDEHPEAGVVCPKIRFFQPPRNIQFAGYEPLTPITLRNALVGFGAADDGRFDTPHETPYAHGAAMMVRREAVEQAGPMPEIYFLYYEELDWCTSMTRAGYQLWYEPRCTIFHKESQSTGRQSPLRTFYMMRNRMLYAWRNLPGMERCLAIAYQMLIVAPKDSLCFVLKGEPKLAKAVWHGVKGFWKLC